MANTIADLPCGIPLCGLAEGEIPQGKRLQNADCEYFILEIRCQMLVS
jgi:hypothetical protein